VCAFETLGNTNPVTKLNDPKNLNSQQIQTLTNSVKNKTIHNIPKQKDIITYYTKNEKGTLT
jgi:hypothetical protein